MYEIKNFDSNKHNSLITILNSIRESDIAKLKTSHLDCKISLYGNGDLGKLAKRFFSDINVTLFRIIDKSFLNVDDNFRNKNFILSHPSSIPKKLDEICLISIVNFSFF